MDKCSMCGDEWLYHSNGIKWLCEACFITMQQEVIKYHSIQDEAYNDIIKNDINSSIKKLEQVKELRIYNSRFFNKLNSGHHYFAYTFIPLLINNLLTSNNPIKEWNRLFDTLQSEE
jgi:hypothetical protein